MRRPDASFIFSSVQLSLFEDEGSNSVHIMTSGEGTLIHKFELSKSKIEFSTCIDDEAAAIWRIKHGNTAVIIKKKNVSGETFNGSVTVKMFGFLPIHWCSVSGKVSQFNAMVRRIKR